MRPTCTRLLTCTWLMTWIPMPHAYITVHTAGEASTHLYTCRLYAVQNSKADVAYMLLQANADPNATTRTGDTCLHWCVVVGP